MGSSDMNKKETSGEWRYQDGDTGCSWLCSSSQEQLTTSHGQDTTEGFLEHWGLGCSTPCTTEAKADCIRRLRGSATQVTILPFPHTSTAALREVSTEPLVGSFSGKRKPRETTSNPSIVGNFVGPLLWSNPRGIAGESEGFNHWEFEWQRTKLWEGWIQNSEARKLYNSFSYKKEKQNYKYNIRHENEYLGWQKKSQ